MDLTVANNTTVITIVILYRQRRLLIGMMYPARGGLDWSQMRARGLSEVGVYTPQGVCITYWPTLSADNVGRHFRMILSTDNVDRHQPKCVWHGLSADSSDAADNRATRPDDNGSFGEGLTGAKSERAPAALPNRLCQWGGSTTNCNGVTNKRTDKRTDVIICRASLPSAAKNSWQRL